MFPLCRRGDFDLSEEQGGTLEGLVESLEPEFLLTMVAIAAVAVAVFWVVSVVVGNWALGALLGGIHQAVTEGTISFGSTTQLGRRYFWPMLVIGLLSGFAIVVAFVPVMGVGVITAVTGQPAFLLALCLWAPLVLIFIMGLLLVVTIAQVHVVLADAGPLEALSYGWSFLLRHLGDLLLVWVVNDVGVGCGAGCLIAAVVSLAAIPALLGFLVNPQLGMLLSVPAVLLGLLAVVFTGIVLVFRKAVWLLAYQRLQEGASGSVPDGTGA